MMVEVLFEKDSEGALHEHPHHQVSYVKEGTFEVTIGIESLILKEGDSFIVPTGIKHGVKALEEGCLIDVFNPQREDFLVTRHI
ncbi:MAG: cupin domain-containing protein [Bacteroidota bacterium]